MTTTILLAALGLVLLVLGADVLVRGASALAAAFGIPPLVIGLTVVGFATSSPELAVSVRAALSGQPDLAVGNAVGSCTFNVLFILGLSALVAPLAVSRQLIRLDVPVMIGASVFFYGIAFNGHIGRQGGLILVALMAVYVAFQVWWALKPAGEAATKVAGRPIKTAQSVAVIAGLVVVGLVMLVVGSQWLVDGAVVLARLLGVSELIIGLTVVAVGTGLPEAATSIMATVRGQREIAVGNVVGSNVFNLLFVIGAAAVLAPEGLRISADALSFDIPVMVAAAVACLPVFFTGRQIARWEGAIFLLYYICYTLYLLLAASQHDALPVFNSVMLAFILPLTLVTLVALSRHEHRQATQKV